MQRSHRLPTWLHVPSDPARLRLPGHPLQGHLPGHLLRATCSGRVVPHQIIPKASGSDSQSTKTLLSGDETVNTLKKDPFGMKDMCPLRSVQG